MPRSRQVRTVVRTASAPFSCPWMRDSSRCLAHRPLPSMMMATWAGSPVAAPASEPAEGGLELKDLFLFFFVALVDELDVLVGHLLDLLLGLEGVVL
jgi:hypothetical protein